MTPQQVFDADLTRMNAVIEAAGAVVDFGDGTFGVDPSLVSAQLLSAYSRLQQFGYANGLV